MCMWRFGIVLPRHQTRVPPGWDRATATQLTQLSPTHIQLGSVSGGRTLTLVVVTFINTSTGSACAFSVTAHVAECPGSPASCAGVPSVGGLATSVTPQSVPVNLTLGPSSARSVQRMRRTGPLVFDAGSGFVLLLSRKKLPG